MTMLRYLRYPHKVGDHKSPKSKKNAWILAELGHSSFLAFYQFSGGTLYLAMYGYQAEIVYRFKLLMNRTGHLQYLPKSKIFFLSVHMI